MLNTELDEMINWCRSKLSIKKKDFFYNSKRKEGYEEAMLNVMSYLNSLKRKD